jgi:hypothetical protein
MSPAPTRTVPGSPDDTLFVAEADAAEVDGVTEAGLDVVLEVHPVANSRHSNRVECFIIAPEGGLVSNIVVKATVNRPTLSGA